MMYYALYPLGVACECWILFNVIGKVDMLSKLAIAIVALVHLFGMVLGVEVTVVAGMDVFVVKWRNTFTEPKYRAWIPVDDGSQAF
jgi:hypothetical protein